MSPVLASENPPHDAICRKCKKPLKEPNSPNGHDIGPHQQNPAASKKTWTGPSRSSDLTRPSPKPIRPKLFPKPSQVFPQRFTSGNLSINTSNNHYHSSGGGDGAKSIMPWPYQTSPLNPPYPSGPGPFFMFHPDPLLTLGLPGRGRFSGNFVHAIGYPNQGTKTLAIPETPAGSTQRPVFNGPSKGSAFRPYKSVKRENRESQEKCEVPSKGKKRASPEASEVLTVMNQPKRREFNLKKEVREQLMFTDFSCLEITNEDRAQLDLSLHL